MSFTNHQEACENSLDGMRLGGRSWSGPCDTLASVQKLWRTVPRIPNHQVKHRLGEHLVVRSGPCIEPPKYHLKREKRLELMQGHVRSVSFNPEALVSGWFASLAPS